MDINRLINIITQFMHKIVFAFENWELAMIDNKSSFLQKETKSSNGQQTLP